MLRKRDAELGLDWDLAGHGGLVVGAGVNPSTFPFCCKLAAGMLATLTRLALRGTGPFAVRIVTCVGVSASISVLVGKLFIPSRFRASQPDPVGGLDNFAEFISLISVAEDSAIL